MQYLQELHIDCKKEDSYSLEARNGVPRAPQNLGPASPKVSQGTELLSRSTCCPPIKPQTSSAPNLKTNDRHISPALANSCYNVQAPFFFLLDAWVTDSLKAKHLLSLLPSRWRSVKNVFRADSFVLNNKSPSQFSLGLSNN